MIPGSSFIITEKSDHLFLWPNSVQEGLVLQAPAITVQSIKYSGWLLFWQVDCPWHCEEMVMKNRKPGKCSLMCLSLLFPLVCFLLADLCSWSTTYLDPKCEDFYSKQILKFYTARKLLAEGLQYSLFKKSAGQPWI